MPVWGEHSPPTNVFDSSSLPCVGYFVVDSRHATRVFFPASTVLLPSRKRKSLILANKQVLFFTRSFAIFHYWLVICSCLLQRQLSLHRQVAKLYFSWKKIAQFLVSFQKTEIKPNVFFKKREIFVQWSNNYPEQIEFTLLAQTWNRARVNIVSVTQNKAKLSVYFWLLLSFHCLEQQCCIISAIQEKKVLELNRKYIRNLKGLPLVNLLRICDFWSNLILQSWAKKNASLPRLPRQSSYLGSISSNLKQLINARADTCIPCHHCFSQWASTPEDWCENVISFARPGHTDGTELIMPWTQVTQWGKSDRTGTTGPYEVILFQHYYTFSYFYVITSQ